MGNDDYGFQLSLLQSWQLRQDTVTVQVAARQQRLITALAIYGSRPRTFLCGLLWPESTEAKALASLRVAVHLVSRQVPGLLLNPGTVLSLTERVDVDLHRVWAQIRELNRDGPHGSMASCLHQLRNAELLPGWYDDWVLFEQNRLRQNRLQAFQIIARESLMRCDFEAALESAEAGLELEPLYESAVGFLVRAQRQLGNNASALRTFEKYETRLNDETGLMPSDALRQLVADLYEDRRAGRERRD